MAKKSFFRQETVPEILAGRKVLKPGRGGDLAAIINSLTPGFAVHVEQPILPARFAETRRFLRYGNEARIGKAPHIDPGEAIAKALHEAQTPFGSIIMQSRIDNLTETRIVLDTCIEGMKLYAYACANAPIDVKWDSRLKAAAKKHGVDFVVEVPSEEEKGARHNVNFRNLPLFDTYSKRSLWTDIGASCDCDYTTWWITSRYIRERVYCQHIIAAYYAVAAQSIKRGYPTPSWAMPFPIFSADAAKFWKKMRMQVVKTKNGRRYPLNASERSLLLGDYIKSHGVKKALCKRRQFA